MPRAASTRSRLPRPRGVALRRTVLLASVAALAFVGWSQLRDSRLVAVETVTVTGVSSNEGAEVRRVLTAAARRMTTLHVREDELRAAVRRFSSVQDIDAQTDFPHGLAIEVTERAPVAEVEFAGQRVPVGAGGRLMRGVRPKQPLPALSARRLAPGGRLTDPKALDAVALLAAAPEILRQRVARVWTGPRGLTVGVRQGPQLYFGDAGRLRAKWLASSRVLAEPSAAGAVYLDVRVPERVAAGGLAPDPQLQPEESLTLNP